MMGEKHNKKILIVDDDQRNRFSLSSYLESFDLEILTAENGLRALELLNSGTMPAVILLDMMMPVMDGYEMLGHLKKNELLKKIPVVAVTARAMKGDQEHCLEAGAWDYVSKPIDLGILMKKIQKWITPDEY